MIEVTIGVLVAVSMILLLEDTMWRRVFGITLLSTTINLILLLSGGITQHLPALIGSTKISDMSNPLPQALALTAIVIGFGLLVFLCVLNKASKADE